MTLILKPPPGRPTQVLELAPTPFMLGSDNPNEVWREGVELFHTWALQHFKAEDTHGFFELAEKMNVHAVIAQEWFLGLVAMGLAREVRSWVGPLTEDTREAHGFALAKPTAFRGRVVIEAGDLVNYDPWTDRSLDGQIDGADMPDLVVDKFFDPFVDEFFIFKRNIRIRPNGWYFRPMGLKEHPRYGSDHKTQAAFNASWREIIDKACSDHRAIRRRS